MDLSLLPHLSDAALRDEAARRGLSVEGLDREGLIARIRDDAAGAGTVPPSRIARGAGAGGASDPTSDHRGVPGDSLALGPTPRPAASSELRGPPLRAARSLLGKVVGIAKAAFDRRASEPADEPGARAHERLDARREPIRTRTMAELLRKQGQVDRARSILRELAERSPGDPEVSRALEEIEGELAEARLRREAKRRLRGGDLSVGEPFVAVLRDGPRAAVIWRLDDEGLARGRELLGADGSLTLRAVRVVAHPDHSVECRREDLRPVERSGWWMLPSDSYAPATTDRLVVSVGVSEGDEYVSVLHATG